MSHSCKTKYLFRDRRYTPNPSLTNSKLLMLLPVPEKQFQSQPPSPSFLSLCYSAAFIGQIPFTQCDLTPHLIQCNCRLLQKLFPAPHFSCVATAFSSHHALLGSLHHSAPCFLVLKCSVWIWPVKLVPVREKIGFCMI